MSRQRIYATLIILGSSILIFRTIDMLSTGAYEYLMIWVVVLLVAELLIDLACLATSIRWWIANDQKYDSFPLCFGAAAAILHAIRVLVFVMGRTGPWINFDVRPEHQALHHLRWTWFGVYFAAIMSIWGIPGVILIWRLRKKISRDDAMNFL